jgi:uncharacterized 2Fe-2S/4Fe-4S cluster protein (DUF4445 family)
MPRVTFHPGKRTIDVDRGERLLVAAWRAGTALKSVCGGRGKCGTCLVEIESDRDALALSAPHAQESALLPAGGDGRRYRLACLAHVQDDLSVRVPPESEAVRSPPRKPFTVARIPAAPLVSSVTVDIAGPYEAPLRPLAQRIEAALSGAQPRRRIQLPAPVLAAFSTEKSYDAARRLTATLFEGREVIRLRPGAQHGLFGLAVDVGTTSVAAFLCDLEAGSILGVRTATNPQAAYGEDVITRMTHIQRDIALLPRLQQMVVDDLSRMTEELAAEAGIRPEDIVDAVAVGNPTMQHILLGINPEPLGRGPYLPVLSEGVEVRAGEIGLKILRQARLFLLPMVAGYIGGDTLAAVLTRDRDFYRGNNLLIDVGTNGEVVLAKDGALTATSCATGPVYEGAHIRCGVRAAPGAIERVWMDRSREIQCGLIPDPARRTPPRPVGLCGSGVISAVAALAANGILKRDGRIVAGSHPQVHPEANGHGCEVLLAPAKRSATGRDIVLTQADVRNVQLGKAALRAGIEILLRESGVQRPDRILLAGTFGNHLDPNDILGIGMVPPVPVQSIHTIGNAAGDGARMALFNRRHRRRSLALAKQMRVLELTNRPEFQDLFVACTALTPDPLEREPAQV